MSYSHLDKTSLAQRLLVELSQNIKVPQTQHITWHVTDKSCSKAKTIVYGFHSTPFGEALFALYDNALCALYLVTAETKCAELERLQKRWPLAQFVEDTIKTQTFTAALDANSNDETTFQWLLAGSTFQLQVWRALLTIPYGKLTTYQAIANAIGNPKAVRAVGSAVGANPLSILIPCHRVIQKSGNLGGYRWGLDKKQRLISAESPKRPC